MWICVVVCNSCALWKTLRIFEFEIISYRVRCWCSNEHKTLLFFRQNLNFDYSFVCRLQPPIRGKPGKAVVPTKVQVAKSTKTSFWAPKRTGSIPTPPQTSLKSVGFAVPKFTKWAHISAKTVPTKKAFVLCAAPKSSKPKTTNKVQCKNKNNFITRTAKLIVLAG